MYILDIMFEIKNRKEFINAFQCFCEDLVKFELPWFEMLYDFSISFISLNLFINPDIFLVKMYLLAGYNSIEINLSFNRNIILLLIRDYLLIQKINFFLILLMILKIISYHIQWKIQLMFAYYDFFISFLKNKYQ